jgi:cell division protein FtsI (penicillin-binding protein 3)
MRHRPDLRDARFPLRRRPRPAPVRTRRIVVATDDVPSDAAIAAWQRDRAAAWLQIVVGLVILGFVVILGRVVQLQTMPAKEIVDSLQARQSVRTVAGLRGGIVDRAGRPIAATIPGWRVFIDPDAAEEQDRLATIAFDIAPLLGMEPFDIDRTLHTALAARPGTRFVPITDPLPAEDVALIRAAIRRGELPGVNVERRPIREQFAGDLAASLVGITGFEGDGLTGLEYTWNERLAGQDGRVRFRRARNGRELWVAPGDHQPAQAGPDLTLSLDLVIQQIAEEELTAGVEACNAQGGRIVVADPQTGELLAVYDMLRPRTDMDIIEPAHRIRLEPGPDDPPLVAQASRLATEPYEPGSTFKPFVWAILTQDGRATPDEMLDTPAGPPGIRVSRRWIRDAYYYGRSDWAKVLVKSMNSGMVIVAMRETQARLRERIRDFGFGTRTNVGLAGESRGTVRSAEQWSEYTQGSVAMGHEISVTPLQMVRAFMAFCRDGTMPQLTLVARDERTAVVDGHRRVMTPEIARLARDIMHRVTTEGTGRKARSEKYTSFGKSGTAQAHNPVEGGYFEDRYVSSYIAGAPRENPRVVVLVVMDDPDKRIMHGGGAVAGPVAMRVFERTLEYLGVPADVEPEPTDDRDGGTLVLAPAGNRAGGTATR